MDGTEYIEFHQGKNSDRKSRRRETVLMKSSRGFAKQVVPSAFAQTSEPHTFCPASLSCLLKVPAHSCSLDRWKSKPPAPLPQPYSPTLDWRHCGCARLAATQERKPPGAQ